MGRTITEKGLTKYLGENIRIDNDFGKVVRRGRHFYIQLGRRLRRIENGERAVFAYPQSGCVSTYTTRLEY